MLSNEEFKELEEKYQREKTLKERYEALLEARTELKTTTGGYQLNSIMCHLPEDVVMKIKEKIKILVQNEIDVLERK